MGVRPVRVIVLGDFHDCRLEFVVLRVHRVGHVDVVDVQIGHHAVIGFYAGGINCDLEFGFSNHTVHSPSTLKSLLIDAGVVVDGLSAKAAANVAACVDGAMLFASVLLLFFC